MMNSGPVPPISPAEILAGLANDSTYGQSHIIGRVQQHIIKLPEVLANWLPETVTARGFFAAKHQFLEWALANDYNYARPAAYDSLMALAEWKEHPERAFDFTGIAEENYMLSDELQLFPLLKSLYKLGQLTYADLIRYQPSVFLP